MEDNDWGMALFLVTKNIQDLTTGQMIAFCLISIALGIILFSWISYSRHQHYKWKLRQQLEIIWQEGKASSLAGGGYKINPYEGIEDQRLLHFVWLLGWCEGKGYFESSLKEKVFRCYEHLPDPAALSNLHLYTLKNTKHNFDL